MRSVAQLNTSLNRVLGEYGAIASLQEWAILGELLSKEIEKQAEKPDKERKWDRLEQFVMDFHNWNRAR